MRRTSAYSEAAGICLIPICMICVIYMTREFALIPNAERGIAASKSIWALLGSGFVVSLFAAGWLSKTGGAVLALAVTTTLFRRALDAALVFNRLNHVPSYSGDETMSWFQMIVIEFVFWLLLAWCGKFAAFRWARSRERAS